MRNTSGKVQFSILSSGIAIIVLAVLLLVFSVPASAQMISDSCGESGCHNAQYQDWKASGHPYKLMDAARAQSRPIPLPEGYTWEDISYVIGGFKWKSRYMDNEGYIITVTGEGRDVDGMNQYNYLTGQWSDYHAGEEDKPYDCGSCHTTGWVDNPDPTDLSGNQDMMPGIHGTFLDGGIQCIQCHGGEQHADFGNIDDSAEACGACHYRTAAPGDENLIPASGGYIRHHEQYNEHLASPHDELTCVACHNPHKRSEWSIETSCSDCHGDISDRYAMTSMADYGVSCEDCHMPMATKSAQATGPHAGDVKTHIFSIDTDPMGDMFTQDGSLVVLDGDGKAAVTMDFACQNCHVTATLEELAKYADGFHDEVKSLEKIGIDPGLTGSWWNRDRAGEGMLIEVARTPGGDLYMNASFYTYDDLGNQVYLFATGSNIAGTTINLNVYVTSGRMWGDDFDPNDGATSFWGTAVFTFPDCGNGTITFIPGDDAIAAGFTEVSYPITRDVGDLEYQIACPTFVNNDGSMTATMR